MVSGVFGVRDTPTKKDWGKLVNRLALTKKWCRVWVMKTNGGDSMNYTETVAKLYTTFS